MNSYDLLNLFDHANFGKFNHACLQKRPLRNHYVCFPIIIWKLFIFLNVPNDLKIFKKETLQISNKKNKNIQYLEIILIKNVMLKILLSNPEGCKKG